MPRVGGLDLQRGTGRGHAPGSAAYALPKIAETRAAILLALLDIGLVAALAAAAGPAKSRAGVSAAEATTSITRTIDFT